MVLALICFFLSQGIDPPRFFRRLAMIYERGFSAHRDYTGLRGDGDLFQPIIPHLVSPSLPLGRKIRLGILSAYFYAHSAGRMSLPIIMNLDPNKFEKICFLSGSKVRCQR